uniref:Putative secreted protein n=1 Tax=Anopheles darlingi TaxID=43151 RepID=A0A2M4DPF0_ANODA
MIEAIQKGVLLVAGAPLVAAAGALDSLKLITDPTTGEQIPIELAYERGLITHSQLPSPERAALLRKALSIESRRSSEGITVAVTKDPQEYRRSSPVALQKMRKCVLRPRDAAEQGILVCAACGDSGWFGSVCEQPYDDARGSVDQWKAQWSEWSHC